MAIIVKNTTNLTKAWGGVTVTALSSYQLQTAIDAIRFLSDPDFQIAIAAGNAVVSDGVSDLNVVDGILHLQAYTPRQIVGNTDGTLIGNISDRLKVVDSDVVDAIGNLSSGQTTSANPVQFTTIKTIDGASAKYECQIQPSVKTLVSTLTVPTGKKWYISAWDGSGETKGFYQLLKRAQVGSTVLYDGCESTTGWTASSLSSFVTTSSSPAQGSNAFSASLSTQSYGTQSGYFEKASLNLDWSNVSNIILSAKRGGGSCVAVDVSLKVYTATDSYQFSGLALGTSFSDFNFDLTQISFSLSAVTKIRVYFTEHGCGTQGPSSVYLDNIRTATQDVFETVDQFFSGGFNPYQNLFPTNLPFEAGTVLALFITNKDSATGLYEVGINGRELTV